MEYPLLGTQDNPIEFLHPNNEGFLSTRPEKKMSNLRIGSLEIYIE